MNEPKIKIKSLEYHRNGVGGECFYVAIFDDAENGEMMGIIFPLGADDEHEFYNKRMTPSGERESWNGRVFIFKMSLLDERNVKFGVNSWRGDVWEMALRRAIRDNLK